MIFKNGQYIGQVQEIEAAYYEGREEKVLAKVLCGFFEWCGDRHSFSFDDVTVVCPD